MSPRIRRDAASRIPLEPESIEDAVRELRRATDERLSRFVELSARSNFSFLAGASPPEHLVRRAAELGFDAIALTDIHGLYGMVRAQEEAKRAGVRLVVGVELLLADEAESRILLHVENLAGYTNLCRILTHAHAGRPRDERAKARCDLAVICAHATGLWATLHASDRTLTYDMIALSALKAAFGAKFSIAAYLHKDGNDRSRITAALDVERTHGVPVYATNDVRYARPEGKPILDVLTCIREGTTLDRAGRLLSPNAEAHLKSEADMERLFSLHPTWISRTRVIADACTFAMGELRYHFPYRPPPGMEDKTADEVLRKLTYEGVKERFPEGLPEKVRAQIEKELALIAKRDVAPYFLSVREIVDIARERDILCQGRGSAANSAVCYCLKITAVDPSRTNLLFERFLSAEREEPPDIDVDFEHERREEVIQEIYRRYGRERAAMVSEVISYRGKSAVREVGKAFGLELEAIDGLSSTLSWFDGAKSIEPKRLREAGLDPNDPRLIRTIMMARSIEGYPRHLSIHVGGFVLSSAPLYEVAPVEPATMPDRTVIPWDKDDLDTLGFFKVDVLGLGMLTAIRKMLDFVNGDSRTQADTAIDRLARIPAEDPVVYESLCRADTVGVFQIESRAQMAMLPRLKPKKFYDLVVEVAIVRPGPIQGGMVHPYLRRRNGEEAIDVPHPVLEPILDRTLGVPLFQEQVMQIAIAGAGYSGGEADQLRRDMAAWRKNGNLGRHKERLAEGFRARGISEAFSERLYAQIQGFGEYGFPESHAASFALLVYASAWLKVHHPASFAAALVNSQPMGFYSPSTILEDARRHGVEIRAICIHQSNWDCTLEREEKETDKLAVRVGLRQIKGLPKESGERIMESRKIAAFRDIEDLAARARLDKRDLSLLAESGAIDSLTNGRREALWEVRGPREAGLYRGKKRGETAPSLPPLTRAEQLSLDYERTGLSTTDHPMRLLRPHLDARRVLGSKGVLAEKHGSKIMVAGMVICRQRPMTASGVVFQTLEDEDGFINLVLWERVFDKFRHVATTENLVAVRGKIEREGDVIHVVVEMMEPVSKFLGRLSKEILPATPSRDFH